MFIEINPTHNREGQTIQPRANHTGLVDDAIGYRGAWRPFPPLRFALREGAWYDRPTLPKRNGRYAPPPRRAKEPKSWMA